jgi:hypothetical protein
MPEVVDWLKTLGMSEYAEDCAAVEDCRGAAPTHADGIVA